MNFRLAVEDDFPRLAEMRWDFQTEDDAETPVVGKSAFLEKCLEYLREISGQGDWTFFIAEERAEIAAHIFVKKIVSLPRPARIENCWAYLTNVYTAPAFRGQGVGAELLRRVRRWSIEQDFELLIVSPSEDAVRFYEREGFTAATDFYQLRLREF